MNALMQNLKSSITGNIPKAILCVRKMTKKDFAKAATKDAAIATKDAAAVAASLQEGLLYEIRQALERGTGDSTLASQTFGSLTKQGGVMEKSGYLAMEVQYNPSSIHMEAQAGLVDYSGGNLGGQSSNQIALDNKPVSTTMSVQLIFDDMNPADAFMLENLVPTTVGNTVSLVGSGVKKKVDGGYSVQTQVDGLMALLTQTETRHVVFFWAKMCFRGELTDVRTRYTMFNKDGNPIRGVVELSIKQGAEDEFGHWDKAFTKAFGQAAENADRGMAGGFSKIANNNFLNLNL